MNTIEILGARSLLIVLVGLLVAACLRNRAASVRHLVYAGILFSLVLLPALRQWAPARTVNVDALPAPMRFVARQVDASQSRVLNIRPGLPPVAVSKTTVALSAAIGWVWAVGCLFLIARLLWQLFELGRVIRHSRPLDEAERVALVGEPWSGLACEIRVTDALAVPATAWMGRPVILLPQEFGAWPIERVRSVLLHEAAHISRSDWFVQLSGRLACALYWPNPLIWLVHRRTMDLAEQSADDLVLAAGITPSRYAEDLLQIARSVRSNKPALTTSMALKNDIGRRIEMILDNNKRRGSVRVGGLLLGGLGIAGATVPAATLLFGHGGWNPGEHFADIASRKNASASEANGFIASLGDGRKVQLLQVGWKPFNGPQVGWRPDGTTLASPALLDATLPDRDSLSYSEFGDYDRTTTMAFIFRVKTGGETRIVGIANGPDSHQADEDLYRGGWTLPPDKDGNELAVCLMKAPVDDLSRPESYTFYIADEAPKVAASYDLATGATTDNHVYAANASFDGNTTANVYLPGVARPHFKDASGNPTRKEIPAIVVSYDDAANPIGLDVDVIGVTRTGRTVESLALGWKRDGAMRHIKAWLPKDVGIVRVEIQTRPLRAAEVLGVHLRPNSTP